MNCYQIATTACLLTATSSCSFHPHRGTITCVYLLPAWVQSLNFPFVYHCYIAPEVIPGNSVLYTILLMTIIYSHVGCHEKPNTAAYI